VLFIFHIIIFYVKLDARLKNAAASTVFSIESRAENMLHIKWFLTGGEVVRAGLTLVTEKKERRSPHEGCISCFSSPRLHKTLKMRDEISR